MRVIRLLCLASLLALVVFSGAAEPGALADVSGVEQPAVTAEVEEETRQDSAGIRITMTGKVEEEEEEGDDWPEVNLAARTGSHDDG